MTLFNYIVVFLVKVLKDFVRSYIDEEVKSFTRCKSGDKKYFIFLNQRHGSYKTISF